MGRPYKIPDQYTTEIATLQRIALYTSRDSRLTRPSRKKLSDGCRAFTLLLLEASTKGPAPDFNDPQNAL